MRCRVQFARTVVHAMQRVALRVKLADDFAHNVALYEFVGGQFLRHGLLTPTVAAHKIRSHRARLSLGTICASWPVARPWGALQMPRQNKNLYGRTDCAVAA